MGPKRKTKKRPIFQKYEVESNTCSNMQNEIDKQVRKAWGRMYDQLIKFVDPEGECDGDVKNLHQQASTMAQSLGCIGIGVAPLLT